MPIQTIQPWGQVALTREVRRAAGLRPGDTVLTRVTGPGTVEVRAIPRLSLAELLARYRIEDAIDERGDREQWQAHAAREGSTPRGWLTASWTPMSSSTHTPVLPLSAELEDFRDKLQRAASLA